MTHHLAGGLACTVRTQLSAGLLCTAGGASRCARHRVGHLVTSLLGPPTTAAVPWASGEFFWECEAAIVQ
jgi:hypothetical protein